jgi:ribonucleoside-triphosphate reductase
MQLNEFIKNRALFIEKYISDFENAATASEVDANANVQTKNVATLEAEIYKTTNILLSRLRVNNKLKELYGDEAPDYNADLESGIIYKHDESSSQAIKPYCVAVNMYPFLLKGTSTLDKLSTTPPKNLSSFCGQFCNLIFLLSSQYQGAVAIPEFFNIFTYYCIKEFGEDFYLKHTAIEQAFQNIVYTLNQPAGNRSYQSPFTNISYFDKHYWEAMFGKFVFPDGSKVSYDQVNFIQKKFMKWFNKERSKCLLTFPVETVALLHDGKDIVDADWKEFTAEMYSEGHSFFTYLSGSADSLSSCCRLRNETKPEFSFTAGNVGVATGSKSVISLNINRIVQTYKSQDLKTVLVEILSRVYKYHRAYNELLKELERADLMPSYSEGYITLNQQFLTIGLNGINEAALYCGIEISDNLKYEEFCKTITQTIFEQNKINSTKELRFNTEFVPAESLGIKNYAKDKADGLVVTENRNCYTSYFFLPDSDISVLEKLRMHGRRYIDTLDGGSAAHINLVEHLTKNQYSILLKYAINQGVNYLTFNIPNSECDDCGHITKSKIDKCPKCGSTNITLWDRIIGYLKPIRTFSAGRKLEASRRKYNTIES